MSAYHYVECGLDNIWLQNGFNLVDTPYGGGVHFDTPDALDKAIAEHLTLRPNILSGKEFRFLRVMLDMSQKRMGELMGREAQTVALWEKANRVNEDVDFMIRHIYRDVAMNCRQNYVELVDYLNAQDRTDHQGGVVFTETSEGWEVAA